MKFRNLIILLIVAVAFTPTISVANESIAKEAIECNDPNGSLSFLERHFPSAFRKKIDGALTRCFREARVASEYTEIDKGYSTSKLEDSQFREKVPTAVRSGSSLDLSGTLKYNSVSAGLGIKRAPTVQTAKGFTTRNAGD